MSEMNPRMSCPPQSRGRGTMSRQELIELLPRHKDFSSIMIDRLNQIPDEILANRASEWAAKFYRMARAVYREYDKGRAFTRTQVNIHGVLSGIITVHHQTEDMILYFFHKRFPKYVIVLYNSVKHKTFICTETNKCTEINAPFEQIVIQLSQSRPLMTDDPLISSLISSEKKSPESVKSAVKEVKELFTAFYESQDIPERKNRAYFNRVVPQKWQKTANMAMEKGYLNRKMDRFLKKH